MRLDVNLKKFREILEDDDVSLRCIRKVIDNTSSEQRWKCGFFCAVNVVCT